jgi:2'-5' RNA ligase
MPSKISSHSFKKVYEDLGINLSLLGCIMMDTEKLEVSDIIDESHLYFAADPSHFWIKGIVSEVVPHVTLLYGLLRTGEEMMKHVNAVLELEEGADFPEHWPRNLVIDSVSFFESQLPDEPYYCLIANINPMDLKGLNDRLRMLPHINTYPDYEPHITLAYIKKDETLRDGYLDLLNTRFKGKTVKTVGLNYGGNKPE